jgi:serine/threonine-protein kinase
MAITDTFVLPQDVLLIPVGELPEAVREKLTCKDDDLAVTRPNVRAPSKIISADAAALLRQFQTPQTIVAAVLEYSQSTQANPQEVLENALPLLRHLIDANVLLDASSAHVRITPSRSPGDTFGNFEIRQAVQVLEDSEVFLARSSTQGREIALKITRPGSTLDLKPMFEREAAVLAYLAGSVAPSLIESGTIDGRHYLAIEWKYGVSILQAAAELRQELELADATRAIELHRRLQGLLVALVDAYARLHERGILHSDVHPSNLLVDENGVVAIVDFGYARFIEPTHPLSVAPRAGVGLFFEPECAQAIAAQRPEPQSSAAGEQYAVAAMGYQLWTGVPHLDFSPKYAESIRQIAELDPRSWSDVNARPWPELESVLRTALSRDPRRRFSSLRQFADRLRSLAPYQREPEQVRADEERPANSSTLSRRASDDGYEPFIQGVLKRFSPEEDLFHDAIGEGHSLPVASADHGAASIAFALLRLACRREDPELLSWADLWITKTLAEARDDRAFYNDRLEITTETVTPISLHHMRSGVYFVRALISRAMADALTEHEAIEAFLQTAVDETDNLDLTLGRMSVLHGCTLLLDDIGAARSIDPAPIITFGDAAMHRIWQRIDSFDPIARSNELTSLGIAHGWAGILYGTLRWCTMTRRWRDAAATPAIPESLPRRLDELADCGTPLGRGIVWGWHNGRQEANGDGAAGLMPGWCNGNAGHVHLWTAAYEAYGDRRYLDLARKAAWGMWEQPVHFNNLCCGAAGCAYAMLNIYRHTRDDEWLTRARQYGHRVATHPDRPPDNPSDIHSLYKGDVGQMVLIDDLNDPD